ncbi:hypothetical protein, partial [Limosilactobacillus oris]|uniref:hypothetical protein n=1 Tax=Limosilactobacillus oris TaxID=1632 RepID=UPI00266F4A69
RVQDEFSISSVYLEGIITGKLIWDVCLRTSARMATPRSKPIWGWPNADLSASDLPASYCAEALLIYKIVKRLS